MIRVMVVDDDVPFLSNLQSYDWGSIGCTCVGSAKNGQDALEKCAQYMPHIVITDINMPVMDGLELTRHLKERFPQIRVILLTVYQDFSYAKKAIEYGVTDYLIKDTQYRLQLPIVVGKAIQSFFQRNDNHAEFLENSEKLLILDHDVEKTSPELESFVKRSRGFLVTLRMRRPLPVRQEILTHVDKFISYDVGWIINGQNCLEAIGQDRLLLNRMMREFCEGRRQCDCEEYFCMNPLQVSSAEEYIRAHHQNIETLEATFYSTPTGDILPNTPDFINIPASVSDIWLHRLSAVMTEQEIDELLNEIRLVCPERLYHPETVRMVLAQMVRQAEMKWAERADDEIYEKIHDAYSMNKLTETVGEYLMSLFVSRNSTSYPCSEAINAMKRGLADPELNLNRVAERVYMSPGYLSKRLKEETGLSFRDMLNKLRMEAAAAMIHQGKMKVYEIAEKTGYQNYRSFASAFESYYGTSPKKYRG